MRERARSEAVRALASVEQLKDTLEAQVRDLTRRLKELEGECSQVRADTRNAITKAKQEAMSMTFQSMVGLCVVAPTVNEIATQQCKAPLPENRVRHIIEGGILPVFKKCLYRLKKVFLSMEPSLFLVGGDAWRDANQHQASLTRCVPPVNKPCAVLII